LFSTARLPSAISPLSLHDALPISCGPANSRHLFNSVRDVDGHLAEQIRDQTEHAAEKVRSGADEAGCGLPDPAEVEREEFSGSLVQTRHDPVSRVRRHLGAAGDALRFRVCGTGDVSNDVAATSSTTTTNMVPRRMCWCIARPFCRPLSRVNEYFTAGVTVGFHRCCYELLLDTRLLAAVMARVRAMTATSSGSRG